MDKLNRLKGAVTRLEHFLADTTDIKTTNVSQLEVKKKTESFQSKLKDIREQYFDIQEISAQQLQEIEDDIDSANEKLEQVEVSLKLLVVSIENKCNIVNINDQSYENRAKVHLPEILLPSFGSDYCDFANFKTQFTNLIINNAQLDNCQKLFHLKVSFKNEAKHLESPDDDFNSLFQALIHRYETIVVDSHIFAILNYEKMQYGPPKKLPNFIDCINKNIQALKVMEYTQNNL